MESPFAAELGVVDTSQIVFILGRFKCPSDALCATFDTSTTNESDILSALASISLTELNSLCCMLDALSANLVANLASTSFIFGALTTP